MKHARFVYPDLWLFSSKTSKPFVKRTLSIILKLFWFPPSFLKLFYPFRKDIRVGVSSIKDNLAKLNEELIDNDELQEKLDGLTNQFHIKYDDFKQKINETEEGITNLQTELETTGDEVKTNTAERIRIAESISRVKRDLDILSEQ